MNTNKTAIDAHVHMVGNGSGGSGCWLQVNGIHRLLGRFMMWSMGLPQKALVENLEELYVTRLVSWIQESSLAHVALLAHDRVYDEQGKWMENIGSHYVPNEYVLKLARQHPELLPVVSIHPGRPDAREELERGLEGGAVMMKLLPNCHHVDFTDRRYIPFWERMAEAGLPLLSHTGGEFTVPQTRPEWADPRLLKLPLECGVKVIAAHCGTKGGLFDKDYFGVFIEMLERHPHLYGDISALNLPTKGYCIPQCRCSPLVERMVHGSDLPVPIFGHGNWFRGHLDWQSFRKWEKCKNPLERDYQIKRAMGFPDEVFTRARKILRMK